MISGSATFVQEQIDGGKVRESLVQLPVDGMHTVENTTRMPAFSIMAASITSSRPRRVVETVAVYRAAKIDDAFISFHSAWQ